MLPLTPFCMRSRAKQINKSSSKFSGLNAQSSPNYNYLSPMTQVRRVTWRVIRHAACDADDIAQAAIGKSDGGLSMCGGGARLAPGAEGRAGINEFLQFQTQMLQQQQQQHNTDVAAQIKVPYCFCSLASPFPCTSEFAMFMTLSLRSSGAVRTAQSTGAVLPAVSGLAGRVVYGATVSA